jgi:hypothetical protein
MQTRRLSKRIPSILEGRVKLGPEASHLPCTIRDLSLTGARIWLPGDGSLPSEFELEIPILEQAVQVKLVWFKAQTHGVMFLEALQHPSGDDASDLLERIQSLPPTSERTGSPG